MESLFFPRNGTDDVIYGIDESHNVASRNHKVVGSSHVTLTN